MYKARLYFLCVIIFVYLIGALLLSTISIHDSRKVGFSPGGRGRAMEISGSNLGRTKYHIKWCLPLHFIAQPESQPVTALVSFPGSGNTWLRYLLQQATGIYTGSIYMDYGLFKNGFPAELVYNASVSVVKTHEWGALTRNKFQRAVLLLRPPGDSILAEFNRQSGGHIGFASVDRYTRANGKYWRQFFYDKLQSWREMTLDWLYNFPGPLHIVMYEQLVSNLRPTLLSLLHFLQLRPPSGDSASLECAIQQREGIFRRRRRKAKLDPFDEDMKQHLEREWNLLFSHISIVLRQRNSSYSD